MAQKKQEEKRSYNYSRESATFWAAEKDINQCLSIGYRAEKTKKYCDAFIKITPLNDKMKRVEISEKVYDEGFFALSAHECVALVKGLELMFRGKINQTEINHLSEDIDGTSLEFVKEDDNLVVNIFVFEKGDVVREYSHKFSRTRTMLMDVDPETGEGQELDINVEWITFQEALRFSIGVASGAFMSAASLFGGSTGNQPQHTGGIIKGKRNKKTTGSAASEQEEKVEVKKTTKKAIGNLFDNDEDE